MPTLYNNNAFSTLAAAITSSGQTSVTVQTGHGDRFPIIVSPDVAFITLENTAGTREVIKITARASASDVLTVTRGEEGTSATTWAIGDLIEQRITAGELTDFRTRPGFTTTATSAGTLTLTKGSTEIQTLTGSTTHTVVLPVVSTLYTGKSFTINNNSTGIVTVNSSGSNAVVAIQPGNSADIICVLITGTTAASWTVMTAFGASNGALPGTLSVSGTATMAAINASGTVAMAGAATVGTTLGVTGLSTLGTDGLLSLTTKGYFNSKYNAAASLWQWGPGAISTANAFGFTVGGTNVLDLLSGGIAVTGTLGVGGAAVGFGNGYNEITIATGANGSMLYLQGTGPLNHRLYGNGSGISYDASGATSHTWYNNSAVTMALNTNGRLNIGASVAYNGNNLLDINGSATGDYIATLQNSAANPYGVYLNYSTADPNNTSAFFLHCRGNGTNRVLFYSNGGLGNYSANNQNLSDETVKSDFIAMPSFRDEFAAMHGKWTRYKYLDQTHSDYNSGYRAQDIRDVFGAKAPELVDWWETETRIEVEDAETGEKTNKMVPIPESERKLAVYNDDLHNIAMSVLSELIIEQNTLRDEFQAYKSSHP